MGYAGKLEEKRKAIELRKKGLSYKEILSKVKVSKSTLSLWCRDVVLTNKQINRLCLRQKIGSYRGSLIGAKVQQNRRLKQERKLIIRGIREVGKLSRRERFLVGIALYAADGSKTAHTVQFTNSDPLMIKFMVGWMREFLEIDEKRLRGSIWIHLNQQEEKARFFWSKLIDLPLEYFHKSYIADLKLDSKKVRKKRHEHGIFSIKYASVFELRRIKGWIEGILSNI